MCVIRKFKFQKFKKLLKLLKLYKIPKLKMQDKFLKSMLIFSYPPFFKFN